MPALLQPFYLRIYAILVCIACLSAHAADQPHWIRVSSDHFVVLTDAGQKKGHEIAARFEQMRAVFGELLVRNKVRMAQPNEIIAIADPQHYAQLAPPQNANSPGFFLRGEDRVYIVLNASVPDPWRAIENPFAHYLLDYNYPPTQPWFDEGFAEYFSSLYFTPTKTELGGDPEQEQGSQASGMQAGPGGSLIQTLAASKWVGLPDLLQMKRPREEETHRFYAQSWLFVHYLISQNKLSETGAYFELVENRKVPAGQAIEQAFGMPVAQLDRGLKDYFQSLKASSGSTAAHPASPVAPQLITEQALPFSVDDVGDSSNPVPLPEAQALVDEMELRIPERREQAVQELEKLSADVKTETVVSHRALAFAHVQKGETDQAFEELTSAVQMNASDAWARFDLALAAYHSGEKGARIQGLANTMESLHIVVAEYPDFAEAYNILGWARLTGGGANAAVEAMRVAVQLSPRDESYQLRLAEAYVAAKKWEAGNAILDRLKSSQNPQIAAAAKKDAYELPFLQKFGIRPAEAKAPAETAHPKEQVKAEPPSKPQQNAEQSDEDSDDAPKPAPASPDIDKRPVKFLKAKLISVDCSQPPAATLLVSEGKQTLKLRASDYKSLLVMGSDGFSCDWKDKPVSVNYRAGGKLDGDLVSIEIQ